MNTIYDILIWISRFLARFAPSFNIAGALLTVALYNYEKVNSMIAPLLGHLDQLIQPVVGNANFSPLSFVNFVFPLAELIGMIIGLMSLTVLCYTIRIIKSFIPTIN